MAMDVTTEASNGMPFLENSLPNVLPDVDDLFGGEVPVNLTLSPLTKELRRRVDDIRRRGCYQYANQDKPSSFNPIFLKSISDLYL